MSPATEIMFAAMAGGAALVAIGTGMTKFFGWSVKTLVREELSPAVQNLTKELIALRVSYEQSQLSQNRGNQELHAIVASIRDVLTEHGERLAAGEEKTEGIDKRLESLERGPV